MIVCHTLVNLVLVKMLYCLSHKTSYYLLKQLIYKFLIAKVANL